MVIAPGVGGVHTVLTTRAADRLPNAPLPQRNLGQCRLGRPVTPIRSLSPLARWVSAARCFA